MAAKGAKFSCKSVDTHLCNNGNIFGGVRHELLSFGSSECPNLAGPLVRLIRRPRCLINI